MTQAARQEIAPRQAAEVVGAHDAALAAVLKIANDPNVDIDRFERLMLMRERMEAQRAKVIFTSAMAELQPKLPVITETGAIKNNAEQVQSTYAKWEDINDAIQPVLHEHGFTLSFRPGVAADGKQTVTAILRHIEGHEDEATVTLPYDSSGSKNNVQAVGSSLSYGKRYAAIAILNITSRAPADRDDDGRNAGLGAAAQKAVTDINMADTLDELRGWKNQNFDGLSKLLAQHELAEVIALYNRRSKTFRSKAQADG